MDYNNNNNSNNNRNNNNSNNNNSNTNTMIELRQGARVLSDLINEVIVEQVFDMHWCIKTGRLTWKELYMIEDNNNCNNNTNRKLIIDEVDTPKESLSKQNSSQSNTSSKSHTSSTSNNNNNNSNSNINNNNHSNGNVNGNGMIVYCPICNEQVSGLRFANHLEKCMRGGKRGARGSRAFTELSLPYHSPKVKIDPHPLSLIIRIKMKNGQVRPGQIREGVSLDEFQRYKQMEENSADLNVKDS